MKELYSERLLLRPFLEADICDAYIVGVNNTEIVRLTEARHQQWSRDDIVQYVRACNQGEFSDLIGLFDRESHTHLGNIRLSGFSRIHRRIDLGIMIYNLNYQGRGLGTEALLALDAYVFDELALHRICADYYSINAASARMFEKAGWRIEGIFREHFYLDGRFVDSVRVAKLSGKS